MNTGPWSFTLDFERPPKGLHANDRVHWRTLHENTQWVRTVVMLRARSARIPALDRVQVDVEWVVGDRRKRDTDGVAPLLKAIYDGLGSDRGTSARIVEDDSPEYMEKPSATIRYEMGAQAHFTVTVTALPAE